MGEAAETGEATATITVGVGRAAEHERVTTEPAAAAYRRRSTRGGYRDSAGGSAEAGGTSTGSQGTEQACSANGYAQGSSCDAGDTAAKGRPQQQHQNGAMGRL